MSLAMPVVVFYALVGITCSWPFFRTEIKAAVVIHTLVVLTTMSFIQ